VVFDSLDPLLPTWLRRLQNTLVEICCAAALAGVAWLMWGKAGQMMEYGDTTAQLKLSKGPFVYGMSVLCAVTSLVHMMLIVRPVAHHHIGVEGHAAGGA
jgi:TRAP-type C4-dicarboxylate transport system permease small subunit